MSEQLINYLEGFVTEERATLFNNILKERTRYITVVLEDIFQPHNASAVLRSCDCFGVQDVHIIENQNEYTVNNEVSMGSHKWLSLQKYNSEEGNTLKAIQNLKNKGYRVVATTPHTNNVELHNFDLSKGKCAFLFGTELRGLSETAIENADEYLKIPMYGFTESFNISVSAAIILYQLKLKLLQSGINWQLSEKDKQCIHKEWLITSIKDGENIAKNFLQSL